MHLKTDIRPFAKRVWDHASLHDDELAAAGLGFFGLLGLFPALLAVVSIYGLVANPSDVAEVVRDFGRALPLQARRIVIDELSEFIKRPSGSLSLGALVGFLAAFWSSSTGMQALIRAVRRAHGHSAPTGFFASTRYAMFFTLVTMVTVAVCIPIVLALPKLLDFFDIGFVGSLLRWPIVGGAAFSALAVIYRYAPKRRPVPRWRDVTVSAALATGLSLVATGAYWLYVEYLSSFASTYGALEGTIVLLLWIYMCAYITLLGAEMNADFEKGRREPERAAQLSGLHASSPAKA